MAMGSEHEVIVFKAKPKACSELTHIEKPLSFISPLSGKFKDIDDC